MKIMSYTAQMMGQKIFNRFSVSLLFVVIVSVVAHWQWFILPGIITANDWWYIHNDTLLEYLSGPRMLEEATDFSPGVLSPTFDVIRILGGIIALVTHAFPVWERIFFLWPMAALGGIPIYLLLYKRFESPLGAIAGSLVYICNSYILVKEISHVHIAVAYLLFVPLLLLAIEQILEKPSATRGAAFTAIALLFSMYEIRILYIVSLVFILYVIYSIATKRYSLSRKTLLVTACCCIVIILAQSFWLLPFILSHQSLGYTAITSRDLFPSFTTLLHAITLSEPSWTGTGHLPFTTQPITPLAYALPVLALLWIFVKPDKRTTLDLLFWISIACIGVFLSKGQMPPFPHLYPWLFENIPGFRLFRESSKFNVFTGLSYAILIAASVSSLAKRGKILPSIALFTIGAYTIATISPFITGAVRDFTTSYNVPEQYKQFQELIQQDNRFSRSLWIPSTERFVYTSTQHPAVNAGSVLHGELQPLVRNSDDPYTFFTQNNVKATLDFGAIRYIGIPLDTTDNIYHWYTRTKEEFVSLVDSVPGLHRIGDGIHSVALWENKEAKQQAYIANNVNLVYSSADNISDIGDNKDSAFLFSPDLPQDLIPQLEDTVVQNKRARPFDGENLFIDQDAIRTRINFQKEKESISTGEKSSTTGEIFASYIDEEVVLSIGGNKKNQIIVNIPSESDNVTISVNNKQVGPFQLSKDEKSIGLFRLHRTNNTVWIYNKIESNQHIIEDPSFEKGVGGQVGDCNNINSSPIAENAISATQSSQSTDGSSSLLLSAGNHIGCVSIPIRSVDGASLYTFSIDSKHMYGTPGNIAILHETESAEKLATIELGDTDDWKQSTISFTVPPTNTAAFTAYLYQPGSSQGDTVATTLFDNIQVKTYKILGESTFNIQTQTADAFNINSFSQDGLVIHPPYTYIPKNIIKNGSFEEPASYNVGDCENTDSTSIEENGIRSNIITTDTGNALLIEGLRHVPCISIPLTNPDTAFDYLLSAKYKVLSGNAPSFRIYPQSGEYSEIIQTTKHKDEDWHEFKTVVPGDSLTPNTKLVLYAPARKEASSVVFDDVAMTSMPILPNATIQTSYKPLPTINTTLSRIGALRYTMQIDTSITTPRLLVLSNRYDEGWRLFVRPQGSPDLPWWQRILQIQPGTQLAKDTHIKANAFTNGWVLNPEEIRAAIGEETPEFVIEYWPQRFMNLGTVVSVISLTGGVLLLLGSKVKKQQEDERTNGNKKPKP